ncbi:hypothetical protein [Streptomyces roseifaciens]|uniref:hypothetical protein n=1 Tax=Streptomyces roseifaciens TaxID=1488406 RepID=UPI000718131D|nr:hypothetical protein [Streptomyces roseifaciens]
MGGHDVRRVGDQVHPARRTYAGAEFGGPRRRQRLGPLLAHHAGGGGREGADVGHGLGDAVEDAPGDALGDDDGHLKPPRRSRGEELQEIFAGFGEEVAAVLGDYGDEQLTFLREVVQRAAARITADTRNRMPASGGRALAAARDPPESRTNRRPEESAMKCPRTPAARTGTRCARPAAGR